MTTTPLPKPYAGVPGFNVGPDNPPPPPTRTTKPDDVVVLRGVRVPLNSDIGMAFVSDCSRNRERIFSDAQIREKYDISETDWNDVIKNGPLRVAVNRECERRTLSGDAAREAAAVEFVKAPKILGGILEDPKANPRHKIEASKELRASARVGDAEIGDAVEKFVISINFGPTSDERVAFTYDPPKQPPKDPADAEDQW